MLGATKRLSVRAGSDLLPSRGYHVGRPAHGDPGPNVGRKKETVQIDFPILVVSARLSVASISAALKVAHRFFGFRHDVT